MGAADTSADGQDDVVPQQLIAINWLGRCPEEPLPCSHNVVFSCSKRLDFLRMCGKVALSERSSKLSRRCAWRTLFDEEMEEAPQEAIPRPRRIQHINLQHRYLHLPCRTTLPADPPTPDNGQSWRLTVNCGCRVPHWTLSRSIA